MLLINLFEESDEELFGEPTQDMRWREHLALTSAKLAKQFEEHDYNDLRKLADEAWKLVHLNQSKPIEILEPIIASYAPTAFRYAAYVINGRWPKGEQAIALNTDYGIQYAVEVLHRNRWPEFEKNILEYEDAEAAVAYAEHVLRDRWIEAEPMIARTSAFVADEYDELFNTDIQNLKESEPTDDELFGDIEANPREKLANSIIAYANYLLSYALAAKDIPPERKQNLISLNRELKEVASKFKTADWMDAVSEFNALERRWEINVRRALEVRGLPNVEKLLK